MNLVKFNEGFDTSIYQGLTKDGVEQIPDEIKNDLIQVDEKTYQKLINHEIMWNNGVLVPNPDFLAYQICQEKINKMEQYEKELNQIQRWFKDNDWKVNKIVIGEWEKTDSRWLDYISERAKKRARQDELTSLIVELNKN